MKFGSYNLDILITGYPGKSVCHGSLGWSTIALLRGEGPSRSSMSDRSISDRSSRSSSPRTG